jgi:hypothetical protein
MKHKREYSKAEIESEIAAYDEVAERWHHVAASKGFRCALCGEYPSHDEREIFFDTGWCGAHGHLLEERLAFECRARR